MSIKPFVMLDGVRQVGTDAVEEAGFSFEMDTLELCGGGIQVRGSVVCSAGEPLLLERAGFLVDDDATRERGEWGVFIDSGTLAWNGVRRLDHLEATRKASVPSPPGAGAGRFHRSSLQTVLWHPEQQNALLVGFCGQDEGINCVDVWPDAEGRSVSAVEAWQEFALRPIGGADEPSPLEVKPGETLELDPLVVRRGDDPLTLLEEFGKLVQEDRGEEFDDAPITGYMTWYNKTAAIDEESVTGNLPILNDMFCGYPQPQRPMLILDHGWQQNASLGPVTADAERFPHGLEWLAERINKQGLEPGIWHSLTNVTEDAPDHCRLAPILATDADGNPLQGTLNLWDAFPDEPAVRTANVPDADLEDTRQWWAEQLGGLSDIGMKYFKLDFLALRTSSDNRRHAHSGRLHERAWETFRDAVTPDAHLAPCSCDTNLALGRCDSVRISSDIGEAGKWPGHADGYRRSLSSIGALWYKQRRFWVNDPDSVQIGKGCSMGEARVRATAAALSGGHLMLSEDLRELNPSRLELFRRLLPAVPSAAVPLDLFDHSFPEGYPAIWQWDVEGPMGTTRSLALFNLRDETRTFKLTPAMFGIDSDAGWLALEWWQRRWLGRNHGDVEVEVPPYDVGIIHARPVADEPRVLSCSHHPSGLYVVRSDGFDPETGVLSGELVTSPGLKTVIFGQKPSGWELSRNMRSHAIANRGGGWQCEVTTTAQETPFRVEFERA